jgi:prepilin-type N-terminal cleavage/methylation domain-containing protein
MSPSLHSTTSRRSRGFTLVEILVVVAIIVILMAILIPTAVGMVSRARNAAIGFELSQLKTALDEYKKEHGDYPPSMDWDPGNTTIGNIPATVAAQRAKWWDSSNSRPSAYAYASVCERHLLRCYPKATDKFKFYRSIAPLLEQDEALVFWLYMIANDQREPFKNFVYNNNNVLVYAAPVLSSQLIMNDFPGSYSRHSHFEFLAPRLVDIDNDGIPAYQSLYSRETTYMYFDSRTYAFSQHPDYAALRVAQPFVDATTLTKPNPKFVNPDTFQILSSGQDGNFGLVVTAYNPNDIVGTFAYGQTKMFPTMINTNEEDSDNLADFTEGRRLIDHRP